MERRTFLEASGGAVVGLMGSRMAEWSAAGRYAATVGDDAPYEFLEADQVKLLDVVTEHFIPTDDTPGAREARVVRFMDHALATFMKDRQKDISDKLTALEKFATAYGSGGAPFLQRTPEQQIEILTEFEKKQPRDFFPIRNLTMAGMFSHPTHGGNFNKAGWKLIGYEDRYSWAPPFGYYDR
jgi:gluconate 2-dehydrogenase gamma chain